jgi:hypothetical protein
VHEGKSGGDAMNSNLKTESDEEGGKGMNKKVTSHAHIAGYGAGIGADGYKGGTDGGEVPIGDGLNAKGSKAGIKSQRGKNNMSPTNDGVSMSQKAGYSMHVQIADKEIQNTDKAIINLMKEHAKLKKRLELVQ